MHLAPSLTNQRAVGANADERIRVRIAHPTPAFEQACDVQGEAEDLLADAEFEVDSAAVLELVRDSDCSAYDCEFVALAVKLDTKLVTVDKKLLMAFPDRAVALIAV